MMVCSESGNPVCCIFILFATEPFGLVKHLPNTHTFGPQSFMAQTEDEMGEEASCERLQPFRDHPIITAWKKMVAEMQHDGRKPILAFIGGALLGKACKGLSIFGESKTLTVHCAGHPTGVLPVVDLEGRHAAVLWKDIRVDQVLHNRRMFVSWPHFPPFSDVFASHGNHHYEHHPPAMMVCSNFLPTTVSEGLSAEEALWMHQNIWKVTLEAGARWWLDP
jgi:hypothetical protein